MPLSTDQYNYLKTRETLGFLSRPSERILIREFELPRAVQAGMPNMPDMVDPNKFPQLRDWNLQPDFCTGPIQQIRRIPMMTQEYIVDRTARHSTPVGLIENYLTPKYLYKYSETNSSVASDDTVFWIKKLDSLARSVTTPSISDQHSKNILTANQYFHRTRNDRVMVQMEADRLHSYNPPFPMMVENLTKVMMERIDLNSCEILMEIVTFIGVNVSLAAIVIEPLLLNVYGFPLYISLYKLLVMDGHLKTLLVNVMFSFGYLRCYIIPSPIFNVVRYGPKIFVTEVQLFTRTYVRETFYGGMRCALLTTSVPSGDRPLRALLGWLSGGRVN